MYLIHFLTKFCPRITTLRFAEPEQKIEALIHPKFCFVTIPAQSFLDKEVWQYEETEEDVGGDFEEVSEPACPVPGPDPPHPCDEVHPQPNVDHQHSDCPTGHLGDTFQPPALPENVFIANGVRHDIKILPVHLKPDV